MNLYVLLKVFFFGSCFFVAYTYVIFPWLLALLAGSKRTIQSGHSTQGDSSGVTIIIAAYNEEEVIGRKIQSIIESDYPDDKIEVLIGSDASDDSTCEIVKAVQQKNVFIRLFEFKSRRGKPAVINDLVLHATYPLIVLTDANVIFDPNMLKRLMSNFSDQTVGLVGANILNIGLKHDGISVQEKTYIERENLIKFREGQIWGTMMGPFGGCFALRKELFEKVPEGFLVDDFYIAMKVIEKKFKCINDLSAVCYEDVSNDVQQEYKRKSRISAGNFQNLNRFKHILFKPFTPEGFCFFSHKFLRWMTPFFILITLFSLFFLSFSSRFYFYLLICEILFLFSPGIDWVFRKAGFHLRLLRFVSYFTYMNLALLKGFFRYMRGINSGVWTPTKRN